MAMTLGAASVDVFGVVTKSGVIGRCYDEIVVPVAGVIPAGAAGVPLKQAIINQATAMGTTIYKILTLDAAAKVDTTSTGLQRMPASTAENTDTKGPSVDKFLSIV